MKFSQYYDIMERLNEAAPPSEAAEDWIKSNKARFRKEYGDDYKEVMYATAWKLFKKGSFRPKD